MTHRTWFAIGDVHGEADKLAELHDAIFDRIAFEGGPAGLIHLGDYVDRGPSSRQVIDRIMKLETTSKADETLRIISLKGNHELMMLEAIAGGAPGKLSNWLLNGGRETLASYGVEDPDEAPSLFEVIPGEHIDWLRQLPTMLHVPDEALAFVHAGIDPRTFPDCSDEHHLWTRSRKFFDTGRWPDREELSGLTVVHGHTPTTDNQPKVMDRRINVDTGACFGGPLTAVMLQPGQAPQFLRAH